MDGGYDILLVEDDWDDAELAIHALQRNDHNVSILHLDEGEKALKYLFSDTANPKVVLLDLRMPKIDGVTVLRRLKADPITKSIPVIALISSHEGRHYLQSFQLQADGYIIKPVDQKKFYLALTEMGIAWNAIRSGS